jgi:2-hydroxychromene-2-carboxylate isomerase
MLPQPPLLEFNYDISCPFAYIASTRISSLAHRTSAQLSYRPVLLGAIYRATSAPQGAGGSASDVYNPTKRAVTARSMARTLKRYRIRYDPPPQHPRKSVNALRLLYCVPDGEERRVLSEKLFEAYWVTRRDVTDVHVLLAIARESGIRTALSLESFADARAQSRPPSQSPSLSARAGRSASLGSGSPAQMTGEVASSGARIVCTSLKRRCWRAESGAPYPSYRP